MSRIEEDVGFELPPDEIRCRTCRFRLPDVKSGDRVLVCGYKSGRCEVYGEDNPKPNGILFRGEACGYYQRDGEAV